MNLKQRLERIRLTDVLAKSYKSELSNLLRLGNGLPAQARSIETVRERLKELSTEYQVLDQLIDKLDKPLDQTILRLHYFDKLSFKEIAIKLFYHEKTIVRYHKKAIEKLKELEHQ